MSTNLKTISLFTSLFCATQAMTNQISMAQTIGPDFNGDGFADLAIGVPGEDFVGVVDAGAVHVLYGTANGVRGRGDQFWRLSTAGLSGDPNFYDYFGASLAWGDFNSDGFDDLAIGIPGRTIDGRFGAGAVQVLFGSEDGLTAFDTQVFHQGVASSPDSAEANDFFGHALVTGDFNDDGFADLAIGVPGESFGQNVNAGAVHVLYGGAGGLTMVGSQFWHQNTLGIRNQVQSNDTFGSALSSGDFDNDGFSDLAIGVPGETVAGKSAAGAVAVIYGSQFGLTPMDNQLWHQNRSGIRNAAQVGDAFGQSVAAGDFDGDGRDDLAIGIPGENLRNSAAAGAVAIIYGRQNGLRSANNQLWSANSQGLGNAVQPLAEFGHSLATGDFNNDGRTDLAIGIPGQWVGNLPRAGAVQVLLGSEDGITADGRRLLRGTTAGLKGSASADAEFGFAVTARDFNGDGFADLAIGSPFQSVQDIPAAGTVNIVYGSTTGIVTRGDQLFHQQRNDIKNGADEFDGFGEVF